MRLEQIISVVQALNEAGVRYLIVGGLAVNAHGQFDPWHYGTWEGARDGVREVNLLLSLAEKIRMLEDMEQLAVRIHRQRLREGLPVDPKIAPLLEERLVAEDQASYQIERPPTPPHVP